MLDKQELEEISQHLNAAKDDLMQEMTKTPTRGCQSVVNGAASLLSDAEKAGVADFYLVAAGHRAGENDCFISAKAKAYPEDFGTMMAELICKACSYDADKAYVMMYALGKRIKAMIRMIRKGEEG